MWTRGFGIRAALVATTLALLSAACGGGSRTASITTSGTGCTTPDGVTLTAEEMASAGLQTYVVSRVDSAVARVDAEGVEYGCQMDSPSEGVQARVEVCFTADGATVDGVPYTRIAENQYAGSNDTEPVVKWRNTLTFTSSGHILEATWDIGDGLGWLDCHTYTYTLSQ